MRKRLRNRIIVTTVRILLSTIIFPAQPTLPHSKASFIRFPLTNSFELSIPPNWPPRRIGPDVPS
jgi:hypothetical protein